MTERITRRIRVYGIVQGVGFRPTVSRHAMDHHIQGLVCNKGPYVEIFAQGEEDQVDGFLDALKNRPPRRAAILKLDVKEVSQSEIYEDFNIVESEKTKGEIFVSPDIAICDTCMEEMYDPKDRRYLHPFINCTCCGPRLTILDALPYDRERTSMKEFPMCPDCAAEYYAPETRRYDAQPVCCPECGPQVYLIHRPERGRDAICHTRQVILDGGIVAIKGIGGFHLCCDASNEQAVERLRQLKRRPAKPFAVMARNMEAVRRSCEVSETQKEVLTGHQKPILLLKKKGEEICPAVAPGNPKVGIMLPYAPVQLLLFDYDDGLDMPDYLVMTSGNASGAPICRDDADAVAELTDFCDCILSHDRKIRIRADDTVMDYYKGKPYMIRRSRGYAPLPFLLSENWKGNVLAVGGELKNTFCLGVNNLFYPSPYVGDLSDVRTVKALEETIGRLETLLETEPALVACDLHPAYNSTALAEKMGLPMLQIQHHYAHVLSCMAENDCSSKVIGVSFDGTGYGEDGTIWGGELMTADYEGYERVGCIEPFHQTGGDAAAREGWRIAVSLIYEMTRDRRECQKIAEQLQLCDGGTCQVQMTMADRGINTVISTSAGRLFDGVSAILGIRRASTFEGEASTALEFAAEAFEESQGERLCQKLPSLGGNKDGRIILATDKLVRTIVEKRMEGWDTGCLAYYFHEMLARQIVEACGRIRQQTGLGIAALSGGVFQNQLLLRLVDEGLEREGFQVLRHSMVPPNDGGIALGQAAAAMYRINCESTKRDRAGVDQ